MRPSPSPPSAQSAAERRAADAHVRQLIATFAPAHERLIGALRRALRKRLPTALEVVYEYRDAFVISYSPSERGYEGVLSLRAGADGVRLYLNQGNAVPDPEKLLRGSGNQARWLQIEGASTITQPAVERLIDEALARNPVPFATTGRGSVIIRSTTASARARRRS